MPMDGSRWPRAPQRWFTRLGKGAADYHSAFVMALFVIPFLILILIHAVGYVLTSRGVVLVAIAAFLLLLLFGVRWFRRPAP
jgi:uncharacterized membrane protein